MSARISLLGSVLTVNGERRRLWPQTAQLLWALMARPIASFDDLCAALWPRPDSEPEHPAMVIKTQAYLLRRALAGSGWTVRAQIGRGWSLLRTVDADADNETTRRAAPYRRAGEPVGFQCGLQRAGSPFNPPHPPSRGNLAGASAPVLSRCMEA